MQRAVQIRNFIAENFLFGSADQIRDEESFLETGLLDSTGVLQLVDFLEERYGIVVENEEVTPDNLDSIERISAYLERKLDGLPRAGASTLETAAAGGRS